MKFILSLTIFFLYLFCSSGLIAQKQVTTFGIQFKPIISTEVANTGPQSDQVGDITFGLRQKMGYSFGMVIRKGISDQISVESGINFSRRNYELTIQEDSTNFEGVSDFRYAIYEIPIKAMVFVQTGEKTYLNAAAGTMLNFLPSNWNSFDNYFRHFSQRKSWFIPALLVNLGFEYRTYDQGYYYFGFSLQQPFSYLTTAGVEFRENNLGKERTFFEVSGNILTIDLRYFFHEPPENKRKRR